jgi:hypothetical protein
MEMLRPKERCKAIMIASVCPEGIDPKVRFPESLLSDLQMFRYGANFEEGCENR